MSRYFLEVSYDGTPWNGWQRQTNAPSVQGCLEDCLNKMLRPSTPIELMGSGRTDTGVHCLRQYAHFDGQIGMDLTDFTHKLNAFLPASISVRRIAEVAPEAHARFSATSRSYYYLLSTRKWPLLAGRVHWLPIAPDWEKMQEAAGLFLAHTDYEAFSKTRTSVRTFQCQIRTARLVTGAELAGNQKGILLPPPLPHLSDGLVVFHVEANRFLKGMVRIMTGALLRIGYGKMTLTELTDMLHKKRPAAEKFLAPAHGLYLADVAYPPEVWGRGR